MSKAKLEALLFVHGEPLSTEKAAKILDATEEEVMVASEQLKTDLTAEDRGLVLLQNNNHLQLVTKPELADISSKLAAEDLKSELTPAALEALSIVAYNGPITRVAVEYIRGVNSNFILRGLLVRGLIERSGKEYQVSCDFLRHLGLTGVEQLPEYGKYRNLKSFQL